MIYIPLLFLVIAACSLFFNIYQLKKSRIISSPKIVGRYNNDNRFTLHVEDYSINKNLRIDKVLYKPFDKHKYFEINFDVNNLNKQTPPVVQVLIDDKLWWSTGKIKVQTNYGILYEYVNDMFATGTMKKYQIIKRIKYGYHKKKYDSQYKYPKS
ncbi:MAG: hypothetical protein WCA84_17565 [Ignavibacteriaceae bacterium]